MPVFSHDELLCKMMAQADKLELSLVVSTSEDACTMVRTEDKLRRELARRVRKSSKRKASSYTQ